VGDCWGGGPEWILPHDIAGVELLWYAIIISKSGMSEWDLFKYFLGFVMALIIFSLLTIPYWQRRKTNQLYTQFKMVMIDGRNTKIEIGCGTLHCCLKRRFAIPTVQKWRICHWVGTAVSRYPFIPSTITAIVLSRLTFCTMRYTCSIGEGGYCDPTTRFDVSSKYLRFTYWIFAASRSSMYIW
jgi:hypothetical protein